MSPLLIIGIGVVLMVGGFFVAERYHVKVLKESDWQGITGSSRSDRIAAWMDTVGMLLVAGGLLLGLLRWLRWL